MTSAPSFPFTPERKDEFRRLVREFRAHYISTAKAQQLLGALTDARIVAAANVQRVFSRVEAGEEFTEEILRQLLPHADTPSNRWRGAWVHPVAAIAGDLRTWYEAAGWTNSDEWPAIATALVGFVRQATEHPAQLADACTMWAALPYSTGFQSGLLTPILNALRPAMFVIYNQQSRNLLNYFAGESLAPAITEYPAANHLLIALYTALQGGKRSAPRSQQQVLDQGFLFAHWLTTEKRFTFRAGRHWALDAGADPWIWQEWCEGNMIAIGGPAAWDELGDLSAVTRHDFYRRRDSLIAQHKSWTKRSAEPFWRFARQLHEGDQVAAYHEGTILGIGTVTGPYYFAGDVPLSHRRPVEWRDLTLRHHGTAFAKENVAPIDGVLFAALVAAPAIEQDEHAPIYGTDEALSAAKAQPVFIHFLAPLLETLQAMGGQGRAGDVLDAVRDRLHTPDESGTPSPTRINRIRRHLYRARHYLIHAGLLTTEQHGIWQLTAAGRNTALLDGDAQQLYEEIEYQQQLTESFVGASDTVRRLAETPVVYNAHTTTAEADTIAAAPDLTRSSTAVAHATTTAPRLADRYPLSQVAAATFLPEAQLVRWVQAIERKGQAIFYGPPGVGKTYLAEQLARHLAGGFDDESEDLQGFVETVQFHAAYAYEDFVQGMRPQPGPAGQLTYPIVPGRFLVFCEAAAQQQGRCTLIIDEINRADLARVFGELMYLLEYRDRTVLLAADGRPFAIPANVRIIGTMNTADRSIALVDHALRRRFAFIALQPDWAVLRRFHAEKQSGYPVDRLIALVQRVNQQIGDPQYAIGHSFFMTSTLDATIADIWQLEIEPYLEEIFFDQPEAVDRLRWVRVKDEVQGTNRE